jgi:hypothetical protein
VARSNRSDKGVFLTNLKPRVFVPCSPPPHEGPPPPAEYTLLTSARLECAHDLVPVAQHVGPTTTCNVSGTWGIFSTPKDPRFQIGENVRRITADGAVVHDEGEAPPDLLATAVRVVSAYVQAQPGHRIRGRVWPVYLGHDRVRVTVPEVFGGCGNSTEMWYLYDSVHGTVTPFEILRVTEAGRCPRRHLRGVRRRPAPAGAVDPRERGVTPGQPGSDRRADPEMS